MLDYDRHQKDLDSLKPIKVPEFDSKMTKLQSLEHYVDTLKESRENDRKKKIINYSGINFLDDKLAEEMKCPICFEVTFKRVTLSITIDNEPVCGHNFCNECIIKHINSIENPKCPICKHDFWESCVVDILSDRRKIWNTIVSCSDTDCDWKGKLGKYGENYQEHLYQCAKKSQDSQKLDPVLCCPYRKSGCKFKLGESTDEKMHTHLEENIEEHMQMLQNMMFKVINILHEIHTPQPHPLFKELINIKVCARYGKNLYNAIIRDINVHKGQIYFDLLYADGDKMEHAPLSIIKKFHTRDSELRQMINSYGLV